MGANFQPRTRGYFATVPSLLHSQDSLTDPVSLAADDMLLFGFYFPLTVTPPLPLSNQASVGRE